MPQAATLPTHSHNATRTASIEERIAVLETHSPTLATKADVRGAENRMILWMLGALIALAGVFVAVITANTARLDGAIAANTARIDVLAARQDTRMDALDAKIDALAARQDTRMDALDAKVDARFDKLDAKIDARFDALMAEIRALHRDRE